MNNSFVNISRRAKTLGLAAILICAGGAQAGEVGKYSATDATFKCLLKMTSVRHFFVDNLGAGLDATVAVAKAGSGVYPEGSLLQLIPNEAMIKQQKGFNPETDDWEFFALDSDKNGSKIVSRGGKEVNNFLGLNCFGCHEPAKAKFDLVCDNNHGCDPLPLSRQMFHAIQHTDARCVPPEPVSAEDAAALKELGPAIDLLIKNAAAKK